MSRFRFGLVCAIALMGCAGDEREVESPPADVDEEVTPPAPLEVLAKVETDGGSVEWVRTKNAPEQRGAVVITGRSDRPPLIDLDTAERMRPVELYLALAQDARIPEALAPFATDTDRALVADPAGLATLRRGIADRATALAAQIAKDTPALEPYAGTCTAGQIATARSVFGNGYTGQATCGDHDGFISPSTTHLYCNGGDCEFPLGRVDGGSCPLSNPCDYAQGRVSTLGMRSNTTGNPHFVADAHRIRGFAMNCTGNGALTMKLRWGGPAWDTDVSVATGTYRGVFVWGSSPLQARARAIDLVANGNIFAGIPASGSTYQEVEYLISGNAGGNDRGIFCTDTQQSLTMTATSFPPNCGHGNVSWCGSFCGGCFD